MTGAGTRAPRAGLALPDFPWEPAYAQVDGLRIARVDEGDGAPVVFFHGEPTDDANKLPGPPDPTATFDTSEPTDAVPASQGMTEVANQDFAKNFLAAFWTGEFNGTINGSLELDWWWSTTGGSALGAQVAVTVFRDVPAGGGVVPPEQIIGRKQLTVTAGPTPVENIHLVPVQGTVDRDLTIQVALVSSGADDIRVHYDSPDFRSRFLVTDRQLTVKATPPGFDGLASAPAQGLAFSASVPAEHQRDESEPLIEINKDGHMFTCGPTGFTNVSDYAQVSTDGGDQIHLLGTPPRVQQGAGGGGDCGLAFGTSRNAQGNYQYAYTGLGPLTGFVTSTSANTPAAKACRWQAAACATPRAWLPAPRRRGVTSSRPTAAADRDRSGPTIRRPKRSRCCSNRLERTC